MLAAIDSIKYVFILASTYGNGNYGAGTYNGDGDLGQVPTTGGTPGGSPGGTPSGSDPIFTVGGLPVTGATLLEVAAALAFATAIGLFVWTRQRRKGVSGTYK